MAIPAARLTWSMALIVVLTQAYDVVDKHDPAAKEADNSQSERLMKFFTGVTKTLENKPGGAAAAKALGNLFQPQ